MTPSPVSSALRHGPGRDPGFDLPEYVAMIDGVAVRYADTGGPGVPMVLLHGLAGNLTHWVHVAPALARHRRVIAVDLPGCGGSGRIGARYTVDYYVSVVLGLLDALGIEKAVLMGHSLGGMVSTAFAVTHPHRIDRIVLVNPAGFRAMPRPLRWAGKAILREPLLNGVLPKTWGWVLTQVFGQENERTVRFRKVQVETHDPAVDILPISRVISDLKADFLTRDFLGALGQVGVPVGLIWGSRDKLVPARTLRGAVAHLPDARVLELDGIGHMPIIEVPDTVVHFALSFLEVSPVPPS